jgi:hypothetical protein
VRDPLFVPAKNRFHLIDQFLPNDGQVFDRHAQTLLCMLAPFCTTQVDLRVNDGMAAVAAFELRLILKKLHRLTTARTLNFKDSIRFPESLILSGTSYHNLLSGPLRQPAHPASCRFGLTTSCPHLRHSRLSSSLKNSMA